jgi:bis(5'-adenosyl)-triphosphatase
VLNTRIDVLVVPQRLAPRLADLTPEEVTDLFLSVQTIGRTIEQATKAQSLTVACQVRAIR